MPCITDRKKEIMILPPEVAKEYRNAIETLKNWDMLNENYFIGGIPVISQMLELRTDNKLRE